MPHAENGEDALPGPPLAPEGTPGDGPRPPVAGPGERIVDMPRALSVDLGDVVHLLHPGRQTVPLDVAAHPLVKKFVVEEPPNHAA